ncbi:putative nuclear RNA export factor SDE5 [Argentina anserina]|uniref:putative nuclear RNA export factor SDE5 n=1 Tax=Argentina anserina TaxID=57926 RepID=UPI0021764243|nr:putative nuclear RNA export factor SDE5 [Potentilla anserina]
MEASGFNGAANFNDEQGLTVLLDAFGPSFTIEEIAYAYCKAGKNAEAAAESLALSAGEDSSGGVVIEKKNNNNNKTTSDNSKGSKKKKKKKYRPVSIGSVSDVMGKQYVNRTTTSRCNGGEADTKPKVLPMPESWAEKAESCSSGDGVLHQDMEDFLFTMLGDGYKLDRDLIRDVLDSCGYDMEKSMKNLFSLSTSASDEINEVLGNSNDKSAGSCLTLEEPSQGEHINSTEGNVDRAVNTYGIESNVEEKERFDLHKELLGALFKTPDRLEVPELPTKRIVRPTRGANYGNLVLEPPKDSFSDRKTPVVYQQHHTEDDADEEDRYQVLRKSVKEYRSTTKEYYQAAVDAFSKGDRVRADKLMEQGHFFQKKARDADEESNLMIFKPGKAETQGDIVLDLQDGGAKEAIRLLKCHISSFAGIPSIKHLKVIIDTKEGDAKKGSRRRLAVLRLLEEESIKWVEAENSGTLLIHLDSINPKKLSFLKK